VLRQGWELCTSPFRKASYPMLLAFALLQDMVLNLEISALCKKLGRRAEDAGNELSSLFGRRIQAHSMP